MEKKTFEDKLTRLNEILNLLENQKLPLEESVKLYEEANKLGKELVKELDEANKKIAMIVENGQELPFDDD